MKKKYIIELEDNQMAYATTVIDGMAFIKLLQTLPYTEPDLEQIRKEAYDKGYDDCRDELDLGEIKNDAFDDGYKCGLNDAWEATRSIYLPVEYGGIPADTLRQMFDNKSIKSIFMKVSASEAIEKIRQYEHEKEEQIHVGDEVITASGKAVVTGVGPVHFEYIYADGSNGFDNVKNVKKTGRNFPEITAVLEKMREGQEQ